MAELATVLLAAIVATAAVAWVARRWIAAGDVPEPRCPRCGYFLTAAVSDGCPECGADLRQTGYWPPGQPDRRHLLTLWMGWTALAWGGPFGALAWLTLRLPVELRALPFALVALTPPLWVVGAWWLHRRWQRQARRPWKTPDKAVG